jgi:hypothetical protein
LGGTCNRLIVSSLNFPIASVVSALCPHYQFT